MLIAFLDLLGFNSLVQSCPQFASQNFERFNEIWKTMYSDAKVLAEDTSDFVQGKLFTAPNNFISISDSVIITAENDKTDQIIFQLCEFVSRCFVANNTEFISAYGGVEPCRYRNDNDVSCIIKHDLGACLYPFSEPFDVTTKVSKKDNRKQYAAFRKRNSILFRGGLHLGQQINILESTSILESAAKSNLNIFGYDYVKAVSLEAVGKGARLFCDSTVIKALAPASRVRKAVRRIKNNKEVYEILWPYFAVHFNDARGYSETNASDKIGAALGILRPYSADAVSLLEYAIDLVVLYKDDDIQIRIQYEKTLEAVALGIYKYAHDNNVLSIGQKDICEIINCKISPHIDFKLECGLFSDFLSTNEQVD